MSSIGIDIGGTAIKAVRLGPTAIVVNDEVPYSGTPDEMLQQVADLAGSLRDPRPEPSGSGWRVWSVRRRSFRLGSPRAG